MKHIRQGLNECFPTTLAMLADKDVNEVIAASKAISPIVHSWSDMSSTANPDEIDAHYRTLARKYAPYLLEHCGAIKPFEIQRDKRFMSYDSFVLAIASGRGGVFSVSRYVGYNLAHIAAFEYGLVYDGCLDNVVTARDYYIHLAKKTILCPFKVVSELD